MGGGWVVGEKLFGATSTLVACHRQRMFLFYKERTKRTKNALHLSSRWNTVGATTSGSTKPMRKTPIVDCPAAGTNTATAPNGFSGQERMLARATAASPQKTFGHVTNLPLRPTSAAALIRCSDPELKHRRLHRCRLDQANAEDANRILPRRRRSIHVLGIPSGMVQ